MVATLLLAYFAAFCAVLLGPWSEWREANAVAASFLNGSLGVVVAFLAAWFLYRARIQNLEHEALIREQAEKARLGEQTVRAILENMPFRAWLKGVDGKFLAVNQSFAASLNKNADEIVSKTVDDLFDPSTASEYREQDRLCSSTANPSMPSGSSATGKINGGMRCANIPSWREMGTIAAIAGSLDRHHRQEAIGGKLDRCRSSEIGVPGHDEP